MRQLGDGASLKMYHLRNACILCILSCGLYHLIINIVSLNIRMHAHIDHVICLIYRFVPCFAWCDVNPVFCRKFPVHSRCDLRRHHRCLYGYRSTPAERIYKYPVIFPRSQHYKARCQIFRKGRVAHKFTVSALMKRLARCIEPDQNSVLINEDTQRKAVPVLGKPVCSVRLLQFLHHRLFDDRLYVRR